MSKYRPPNDFCRSAAQRQSAILPLRDAHARMSRIAEELLPARVESHA